MSAIWIIFMAAFVTISVVFMVIKMKKNKSAKEDFLAQHPDAAKIYAMRKGVVTSDTLTIHLVDDALPVALTEAGANGIYIAPGEHKIQISSTYTRPGVMYRSVSQSTGTVDKIVTIKPYAEYDLTFDRKEGTFSFDERVNAL